MPISMYQASVPVFTRGLLVLSDVLAKGATHARETSLDPVVVIGTRLASDMMPLSARVQRASDTAKLAITRLIGETGPSFADEEVTFEDLRHRCTRTISYIETTGAAKLEGSETRQISFGGGSLKATLPGDAYLLSFAVPNFFFHVTTAYDILRHIGVPLGKLDYIGTFEQS